MAQRWFIMSPMMAGLCSGAVAYSGGLGFSSARCGSAVIPSPARTCMPHHPGSRIIPAMTGEQCVAATLGEDRPGVTQPQRVRSARPGGIWSRGVAQGQQRAEDGLLH
jgi:hypothetical protein